MSNFLKTFCLFGVCYFDIEMLVVCVDIGSSVGGLIDIERSSINPYTTSERLFDWKDGRCSTFSLLGDLSCFFFFFFFFEFDQVL